MDSQAKFILTMVLILVAGIIVFFLTGVLHVKKNQVVVVAQKGKPLVFLSKGWHYRLPWLFRVSPNYPLTPTRFSFRLSSRRKIQGLYQVSDPALYFVSQLTLRHVLKELSKETKNPTTLAKESTQVMQTLGVSLSQLEIIGR